MGISLFGLLILIILWLLPILIIATSKKTRGGEKIAWLLAVIFVSWFAWVFYMLIAPLKPNSEKG